MIDFNPRISAFLWCGTDLGPATRLPQFERALGYRLRIGSAPVGWTLVQARDGDLNLAMSFRGDRAHSGYFWADVAGAGSWDDLERIEAERQSVHVAIMRRLFGAESYRDASVDVHLVRDPRSSLEQIAFAFTQEKSVPAA